MSLNNKIRVRPEGAPLRLIWSGQHTSGKALNLGLKALSRLPADMNWKLHVLGKGPKTGAWRQLASRLGIDGRCTFHGWMPREKAISIMSDCHVILITSLRDLTSTVTIEALALGLPIICPDHCGFSVAVNDSCGVKIPVTRPREMIGNIALAVEQLYRDEAKRCALARGAQRRSRLYRWEVKADRINQIYYRKLGWEIKKMVHENSCCP